MVVRGCAPGLVSRFERLYSFFERLAQKWSTLVAQVQSLYRRACARSERIDWIIRRGAHGCAGSRRGRGNPAAPSRVSIERAIDGEGIQRWRLSAKAPALAQSG